MRIVDFNFLADPTTLAGHKDFYVISDDEDSAGAEELFMQEDIVLRAVDVETYEAKRNELLKK